VTLLDGTAGYLEAAEVESSEYPIRRAVVERGAPILADASGGAVGIDSVRPGTAIDVLGASGDYLFVRGPSGRSGWMLAN
jgi:hypothetical protein